jgi:hypothetical protein
VGLLIAGGERAAQVTFSDAAPGSAITSVSWGRGSAMIDLDGDDLLDIFVSTAKGSEAHKGPVTVTARSPT